LLEAFKQYRGLQFHWNYRTTNIIKHIIPIAEIFLDLFRQLKVAFRYQLTEKDRCALVAPDLSSGCSIWSSMTTGGSIQVIPLLTLVSNYLILITN
jgi:hypothetical protein